MNTLHDHHMKATVVSSRHTDEQYRVVPTPSSCLRSCASSTNSTPFISGFDATTPSPSRSGDVTSGISSTEIRGGTLKVSPPKEKLVIVGVK